MDTEKENWSKLPHGDVLEWPSEVLCKLLHISQDELKGVINLALEQRKRLAVQPQYIPQDQEFLQKFAQGWKGAGNRFEESDVEVDQAHWRVDPEFPLDRLQTHLGSRAEWAQWFSSECFEAVEDCFSYRYADLFLQHTEEELCLVELPDGRVDVWDGWHRLAAAIVRGDKTLRAVVGTPTLIPKYTP